MTYLWLYLIVAAFFAGDFISTDRWQKALTVRGVAFSFFAALIWPIGIALTYIPSLRPPKE